MPEKGISLYATAFIGMAFNQEISQPFDDFILAGTVG
jgi:hypothetical protein